jgi:hypothetical protein
LTEQGAGIVAAVAVCESARYTLQTLLSEVMDHREPTPFGDNVVVFLPPDLVSRIEEALS